MYTGQTRWICVEKYFDNDRMLILYRYALGYDKSKSCSAQKILRFANRHHSERYVTEIYEFKSNSWRVLDVTCDWFIEYCVCGVSLKGNMYWQAASKDFEEDVPDFLLCFHFTEESFGPHLPLPFESCYYPDIVTLSAFGEEQLAVLFQPSNRYGMEIWVTTKIEPSAVSWSKFLAVVDMRPLYDGTFLIDEKKSRVVVFDASNRRYKAYIIGEKGYFKEVDLGKIAEPYSNMPTCSYVPSAVSSFDS